jgi:hypothetical protein
MPTTDAAAGPIDVPRARELSEALQQARPSPDCKLYVLLDGARIPKLWVMLRELRVEHKCLFRQSPNENLTHVAPFLARFDDAGNLILWLAMQNSALEAAVVLYSSSRSGELFRHLRRFLLVLDTAGKENYLRFYDPRVLRPFLESSTSAGKQQFAGPVSRFLACDAAASDAAGKIVLVHWDVPRDASATLPPPSATDKFRLSKQHESAFDRDCMERYDRRCAEFLRQRYSRQLAKTNDAALRALVHQAKELGPKLGLPSGRDIAILAELLALGFSPEMRRNIETAAPKDRPETVRLLRDRLILDPAAAAGA